MYMCNDVTTEGAQWAAVLGSIVKVGPFFFFCTGVHEFLVTLYKAPRFCLGIQLVLTDEMLNLFWLDATLAIWQL